MTTLAIVSVLLVSGMAIGKWLTDRRWRGNASEVFRVASGGRLYKVADVTPWDESVWSLDPGEPGKGYPDGLLEARRRYAQAWADGSEARLHEVEFTTEFVIARARSLKLADEAITALSAQTGPEQQRKYGSREAVRAYYNSLPPLPPIKWETGP
jgi:hypothetical protein